MTCKAPLHHVGERATPWGGGIARRATKIDEVREQGITTIVVDGGSCAPEYNRQGEIKFEVLLESFRQMKYDAISIGEREIMMHRDTYNVGEKLKGTGIPIVTLNVAYRGERLRDEPLIIRRGEIRVGVFSLFISGDIPESAKKNWTIEDPEKVIDGALAYARKNADFVVAMLHGDLPQVREFVKRHKGMDIVIVANSAMRLMRPEKIDGSLLICTENQGKYLGRVDASLKGGNVEVRSPRDRP
jgi:2',3'-cyclic-nucleotide 2'-phosphodiesterase (5'-nucleotidase family)